MNMEAICYDVVILSDLHLGSELSRAREALELLRSLRFRRLILSGDIFCDLNFRRLKKEHWHFLSYIRKLSNPKRGVDVVWVEGNHDFGLTEVMSHLVGVSVHKEYTWESEGERHLAVHGHQFDSFVVKNYLWMTVLAGNLFLFIQKLSPKGKFLAQLLDRLNTQWQRLTPKVAMRAVAYARSREATRIFCGHTHKTNALTDQGVSYYNTGSWTNGEPSYITILGKEIAIHVYLGRTDDCHSGEERRETSAEAFDIAGEAGLPADVEYESVFS